MTTPSVMEELTQLKGVWCYLAPICYLVTYASDSVSAASIDIVVGSFSFAPVLEMLTVDVTVVGDRLPAAGGVSCSDFRSEAC